MVFIAAWFAVPSATSAQSLDPALKAASELPRLHSLLVSRRGEVILERYFNGRRATTPANVKSVSKSIISVPSLDLVVVSTSAATVSEERRTHRRTVDEIIEQLIVASIAGTH